MKAISLWQPWASLLVCGAKGIETRSWPIPLELPRVVAIHAAKAWTGELYRLSRTGPFRRRLEAAGVLPGEWPAFEKMPRGKLPFGAIVGVVRFVSCEPTEQARKELLRDGAGMDELQFGDYSPGRFAWRTSGAVAFAEPIPCRGRQSFFDWEPPEVAARTIAMLETAL